MSILVVSRTVGDFHHHLPRIYEEQQSHASFVFNVSEPDSSNHHQLLKHIASHFKHPAAHILINAAALNFDQLLIRSTDDKVQSMLDTNVRGTLFMCKAFLTEALKHKLGPMASIVNVSSVVGLFGATGQSAYSSTKSAIQGLTLSLAQEVGSRGIRVNAVAPGFVMDTGMTRHLDDARRQQIMARTSLQRFATSEEIAQVVLFLASEQASYITGQVLAVDGGQKF